jgi:hypothetical protein
VISDTGANDHDLSVEGMRDYLFPTLLDEGEESTDRAYLGLVLSGDGFRILNASRNYADSFRRSEQILQSDMPCAYLSESK